MLEQVGHALSSWQQDGVKSLGRLGVASQIPQFQQSGALAEEDLCEGTTELPSSRV